MKGHHNNNQPQQFQPHHQIQQNGSEDLPHHQENNEPDFLPMQHQDMKQKPEIEIDTFNRNIIERVIEQLKREHEQNAHIHENQTGGFGAFGGINEEGAHQSMLDGDESSFGETLRQLQSLWERSFRNRCQNARDIADKRDQMIINQQMNQMNQQPQPQPGGYPPPPYQNQQFMPAPGQFQPPPPLPGQGQPPRPFYGMPPPQGWPHQGPPGSGPPVGPPGGPPGGPPRYMAPPGLMPPIPMVPPIKQEEEKKPSQESPQKPILGKRREHEAVQEQITNKRQKLEDPAHDSDSDGLFKQEEVVPASNKPAVDDNASDNSDDSLENRFIQAQKTENIKTKQEIVKKEEPPELGRNQEPEIAHEPSAEEDNEESEFNQGSDSDSDEDEKNGNENLIVAQYKMENRVRSTFKFTLANVVMFINGQHYFMKELKAHIKY